MLEIKLYTLFLKIFLFISIFNFISCDFCTIKANCQCRLKNITGSTLYSSQYLNDSNEIDICVSQPLNFTSNAEDSIIASNLIYQINCKSLTKLNNTRSELYRHTHNVSSSNNDLSLFTLVIQYPCDEPPKKPDGYSTGSILNITFFTLCFAYLGLGLSINFFLVGARGVEMIPNLDFWKDFPALVLDGVKFLQNGCTTRPSDLTTPTGVEGYDAI